MPPYLFQIYVLLCQFDLHQGFTSLSMPIRLLQLSDHLAASLFAHFGPVWAHDDAVWSHSASVLVSFGIFSSFALLSATESFCPSEP